MAKIRRDIYRQKSVWKYILAIVGALMLAVTLIYSSYLARNLKENELTNANLFKKSLNFLQTEADLNADTEIQETIVTTYSLPVILKLEDNSYEGYNFGGSEEVNTDQVFLKAKVDDFLKSGLEPLRGGSGYSKEIYYFNSSLLDYINYYPFVQLLMVGLFIALGYFMFNSSRKAEQNRVWAGMAKETAHQLGTPISAIMGWISYLREIQQDDPEHLEVIKELQKDVDRLELVADRFSKIGSEPELKPQEIEGEVQRVLTYMSRRAPRKVTFLPLQSSEHNMSVQINDHLFDWVLENLLRNSLDAMDGKGEIAIKIYKEDQWVCIDSRDNGKGIPQSKWKTIFQPGYSTKQRGWGLGLSLAKRIIEDYHGGKIFVKNSKLNEGTTFTIKLPAA